MKEKQNFNREGYLHENYRYFHLRDTAGQELDFHFHDFDKLVLLLAGKVDYAVEDVRYRLKPWNVLLVKHHTIHKAIIDKTEPYERIIIYLNRKFFDRTMPDAGLLDSFELADKTGNYLLFPDDEQRAELEDTFLAYEKAMADDRFGAQAMRDTLIMQSLIQIGRMAAAPQPKTGVSDEKVEKALSYINENLCEDLTVDLLAEQVFLSKYHFMRLFKAQTGSTVHAYVRQRRLLNAARLIRDGISANKAAADSGFSDYSTFHRAFKESFGVSPGQLKGRQR